MASASSVVTKKTSRDSSETQKKLKKEIIFRIIKAEMYLVLIFMENEIFFFDKKEEIMMCEFWSRV